MVKGKKPTLPVRQLTILAICRFAEPVASTSVYPYIPEMIQSFNIPIDEVAKYAGWLSAVFSLSQCLTAIAWGRASDRLGRKPMILLALACVMVGSVSFGFSSSLAMAFVTRSIQGMSSGNVGIIRTSVAEMVPERELQPRAFSIMPLVWNIGSIFGPSLGGSLVQPVERYGGLFKKFPILAKYPYAFPNILTSGMFLIGIITGILFLRETHEDIKHRRDYGLVLGALVTRSCRERGPRSRSQKRGTPRNSDEYNEDDEAEPFLGEEGNQLADSPTMPRKRSQGDPFPKPKASVGWDQVFSTQSNINLIAYTGLAMHSIAYDQVLPVFLNYPPNDQLDSPVKPPLKFAGGFGLKSPRIGLLFTIYGFFGMLVQFLVFPPVARRYGVLKCFKACALTFPIVYLLQPFTSLIKTSGGRQVACLGLMLVKCVAGIFAFPCSTILLTNSAASLKILGTLNGVATSVSAMGRAAGPALAGAAFTLGVDHGYMLVPFWVLAVVSVVAAIPIWWLSEMEGFSAKDNDRGANNHDDDDDEIVGGNRRHSGFRDEDEDHANIDIDDTLAAPTVRDIIAASGSDAVDLLPSVSLPASRTITSSTTSTTQSASASATESQQTHRLSPTSTRKSSTAASTAQPNPNPTIDGYENNLLTRIPSPVGTGQGIVVSGARRYSSDLGVSRAGMGTGGSSFH